MSSTIATIETSKGQVVIELDTTNAPITTDNFIGLANRGFYNGLTFHRYEPGFVIQGGDPVGNGTGGSGKTIPLELTGKNKHDAAGTVAMARSSQPNSASCQFYITLAACSFLDANYATFGKVISGLDAVLNLRAGDTMSSVTITVTE